MNYAASRFAYSATVILAPSVSTWCILWFVNPSKQVKRLARGCKFISWTATPMGVHALGSSLDDQREGNSDRCWLQYPREGQVQLFRRQSCPQTLRLAARVRFPGPHLSLTEQVSNRSAIIEIKQTPESEKFRSNSKQWISSSASRSSAENFSAAAEKRSFNRKTESQFSGTRFSEPRIGTNFRPNREILAPNFLSAAFHWFDLPRFESNLGRRSEYFPNKHFTEADFYHQHSVQIDLVSGFFLTRSWSLKFELDLIPWAPWISSS